MIHCNALNKPNHVEVQMYYYCSIHLRVVGNFNEVIDLAKWQIFENLTHDVHLHVWR